MGEYNQPFYVGTGRGYYGPNNAYLPPLEYPEDEDSGALSDHVRRLKNRIKELEGSKLRPKVIYIPIERQVGNNTTNNKFSIYSKGQKKPEVPKYSQGKRRVVLEE